MTKKREPRTAFCIPSRRWEEVYPVELVPKIQLVLALAKRKFPRRNQLNPCLKFVIVELTPTFCRLRSEQVARAMGGFLFSIAVPNTDNLLAASNLIEELEGSDEWLTMLGRIAEWPTAFNPDEVPQESAPPHGDPLVPAVANVDKPATATKPDFQLLDKPNIYWRGRTITLTSKQYIITKCLYDAHESDAPEVYHRTLVKAVGREFGGELRNYFRRRNKELLHHKGQDETECLILGNGHGFYRLNLPAKALAIR